MVHKIIGAPNSLNGNLEEFYTKWANFVLINSQDVIGFHKLFYDYYFGQQNPIFLVRMVKGMERGNTIQNRYGHLLRATDNAPAWWIHYQLYSNQIKQTSQFSKIVENIPCHMFAVRLPDHISRAGWHVAHIFDTKDGQVDYENWNREELIRRTARNIHPCNYFYVPKIDWQSHGGDPNVVSFFYEKFKLLYEPIWQEFLLLVDGEDSNSIRSAHDISFSYGQSRLNQKINPSEPSRKTTQKGFDTMSEIKPKKYPAIYKFSRLCFKADVIEPLGWHEKFCVVTPQGSFAMTKQEFYYAFQNVVQSKSYQQERIYHYPKLPEKALQFLVKDEK